MQINAVWPESALVVLDSSAPRMVINTQYSGQIAPMRKTEILVVYTIYETFIALLKVIPSGT